MDIMHVIQTRYSTKVFDPSKKLTDEQLENIENLLRFSPSSTNIQPWHFIVAASEEGKKRVAKSAHGFYSFNETRILNASAVIVFAAKASVNEDYLLHVVNQEDADKRFLKEGAKEQNHGARTIFANMHRFVSKDFQQWADKQVYLNLGNFLLGVACLGLDALPMEGLDMKVLDEEFGLNAKGFTASFAVSVGYHAENDFNKGLPKSRLPKEEIIERV